MNKKRSVTRGLKVITVSMAEQQSTSGLKLVPGKKLCTSCRKNLSSPQQLLDSPSGDEATDTSKEPSDDDLELKKTWKPLGYLLCW